MKQVYESGAMDYFRSIWNVIDSLMLTFLLSSFTLDIVIPMRLSHAIKEAPLHFNISGETIEITEIPTCYSLLDGVADYFSNDAVCSTSDVALYGKCIMVTITSNHCYLRLTGWMTVVAPADRPKSVCISGVIERICSVFVSFNLCIVCRLGMFVIQLRQISSLFSLYLLA